MAYKKDDEIDPLDIKIGESVGLMQLDHGLRQMRLQVDWVIGEGAQDYEIDLSCFLLGTDGQTRKDSDFIFYNNPQSASMAVKHGGDASEYHGTSEYIEFDFANMSFEVSEALLVLSLYDGDQKNQLFDRLIQLTWKATNLETTHVVAAGQYEPATLTGTVIPLLHLTRNGSDWSLISDGKGHEGGLAQVAQQRGLLIAGQ